jgi:pimeloyl-ACP methyl ester carboxylesterase
MTSSRSFLDQHVINVLEEVMTALRAALLVTVFMLSCPAFCSAQTGIFAAGSRHLYLHCEGKRNGPVVILSTGLYREASDWKLIMPEIARFTQVCAYDREGLGQSTVVHDPARPESESTDEQVEDLKNLLASAHVDAPYILVGHSAGGVLVRRFARYFPDRVAGFVFIDSAHEEQIWRFQAIDPRSVQGPPADPVLVKRNGGLSPGELLNWHYDKPLIVLEHGIPLTFEGPLAAHTAEFNAAVDSMARDLASRSSMGQLRIAIRSGHEIMLDEPTVVVEAVHDSWSETLILENE